MLTVISFNVNSLRQRMHQLKKLVETYSPDFIGLQETKVTDEDFPESWINELGYRVHFHGQKTHYGVALLSKNDFISVKKGFDEDTDETQKRIIMGRFDSPFGGKMTVINGYFPQGENREHPTKFLNKKQFYSNLSKHLNKYHSSDEQIIVMGDMNVAPGDDDIGIGQDNHKRWLKTGKCSFLPEERKWLKTIENWGLEDTYRLHHPTEKNTFSWFDYRNRGFQQDPKRGLRIDFILATKPLRQRSYSAGIDYEIRAMEKPSDHCPIWAIFK